MIKKLRLINFKSFKDVELDVGQLTLLLGTNASGKSNLRDAFRFLHGIGRGYAIADIIGGKYGEGGERVWGGIRGGPREIVFGDEKNFTLEVNLNIELDSKSRTTRYHITVDPGYNNLPGKIISEWLRFEDSISSDYIFWSENAFEDFGVLITLVYKPQNTDTKEGEKPSVLNAPSFGGDKNQIDDSFPKNSDYESINNFNSIPVITQIPESKNENISIHIKEILKEVISSIRSLRFLDLNLEVMRKPSLPGQNILSDQGANLSSVLLDICSNPQRKGILVSWLQALTPMDTSDFEFTYDQRGYVLVNLVESNGRKTSAYSASDGTLRFLAMLAALLGPETARCYFFEELDNGIHPTRLHLLLQLIEQHVAQGTTQVISTTHSPQLLRLVSPNTLASTSIIYRLPEHAYSQIKRLYDIPDIQRVLEQDDPARLLESGWFEDAIAFTSDESDT
ncbi:MAG: ATP-binding protein [Roseiflexaceae bacterium]